MVIGRTIVQQSKDRRTPSYAMAAAAKVTELPIALQPTPRARVEAKDGVAHGMEEKDGAAKVGEKEEKEKEEIKAGARARGKDMANSKLSP